VNIETAKASTQITAKLTGVMGTSTFVMAWFQTNAAGVGAICTVITCIAYIYFQKALLKKDNKHKEEVDKLIKGQAELKFQLSNLRLENERQVK